MTFDPVDAAIALEVFSAFFISISATTTEEPASANLLTIPAPIPSAPPVTTYPLSLREISCSIEREVWSSK